MDIAVPILGAVVGNARPVSASGLQLCCLRMLHNNKHLTNRGDEATCDHCDTRLAVNVLGAWDRPDRGENR